MLFCFIHRIIYFHKGEEQAGPKPLRGEEEVAASGGDGGAGKKEFFRGRVERGRFEPCIPYTGFSLGPRWAGSTLRPLARVFFTAVIRRAASPHRRLHAAHRCGQRTFLFRLHCAVEGPWCSWRAQTPSGRGRGKDARLQVYVSRARKKAGFGLEGRMWVRS